MDIREIIESTRSYNLHSHTQFCDGRADMETMVKGAVADGFTHYGFTPHSPIPIESGCNMPISDVEAYFAEKERLSKLFEGKIRLYAGMEIDYLGEKWGPSHPYFSTLPLDYKIGSVHFIPTQDGKTEIDVDGRPDSFIRKMHEWFDDDIRYVVDTFFARSLSMIEAGGFDIFGHFDKIGFNASAFSPGIEDESFYRRHIDDMIEAIRAKGIIAEINTKAYAPHVGASWEEISRYTPRFFPSPDTIRRLVRAGIPLAVNSDAHFPDRIMTGRKEAFEIIEAARHG